MVESYKGCSLRHCGRLRGWKANVPLFFFLAGCFLYSESLMLTNHSITFYMIPELHSHHCRPCDNEL